MSYDLSLYRKGIKDREIKFYYDYEGNITFNVNAMLEEALGKEHFKKWDGLPADLWIDDLEKGIDCMKADPTRFKQFDSPNGWGTYDHTLPALYALFKAVKKYGDADGFKNVYLEVIR